MKKLLVLVIMLSLAGSAANMSGVTTKSAPKQNVIVSKAAANQVSRPVFKTNVPVASVTAPKVATNKLGSCFWNRCSTASDCCPDFPECSFLGLCH